MFVYTKSNACHATLSYTIDYCKSAAISNCSEPMSSTERLRRRRIFQDLPLNHLVNQPRHVADVHKDSSSLQNFTFFLLRKLYFYPLMWEKQLNRKVAGHTSTPHSYFGISAVSHCRCKFCLIFTIDTTWRLQLSCHAVVIKIVCAYEQWSPNRRVPQCTHTTISTWLFSTQPTLSYAEALFHRSFVLAESILLRYAY